jgi:hypothetical protein
LNDFKGDFKIAQDISFNPSFASICGLTTDDVIAALKLLFRDDEEKVEEHLTKLEYYTNGYHFSSTESVPKVFNPETVMWYLDVIFLKQLVLKNPVLIRISTYTNTEVQCRTSMTLRIPESPGMS